MLLIEDPAGSLGTARLVGYPQRQCPEAAVRLVADLSAQLLTVAILRDPHICERERARGDRGRRGRRAVEEPEPQGRNGACEPDGRDRLRFRNSLVRDAAYEGLAFRVRGRIHRTAGEVLERLSTGVDADSPTLELHFARAGDAARTWRYAQMAGLLARRLQNAATMTATVLFAGVLAGSLPYLTAAFLTS